MTNKNSDQIKACFNEFLSQYDVEKQEQIWVRQSAMFKDFWQNKILKEKSSISEEFDYDPIIRLIDVKARGFRGATDVAVAHVQLSQGTWYRLFNDLRSQKNLRLILNKIFTVSEDQELIVAINNLVGENEKNKNGLTGKSANALNALLFLNNPLKYLSCVSLTHRYQIITALGFGDPAQYKTYGEQVINSNRDILLSFRDQLGIDVASRTISDLLYFRSMKNIWSDVISSEMMDGMVSEDVPADITEDTTFSKERQLEDFLVEKWESTELGRRYDLIEEDEEMVSQQYPAGRDYIDLLVKDKNNGQYVVIELKRGQAPDDTVGQLARYMGWVKKHKAEGKDVRGIIIANGADQRLLNALSVLPNSELLIYRISFTLEKPQE